MLNARSASTWMPLVERAVGFALLYLVAAELGHALTFKALHPPWLSCWPPAGLLLACLAQTRFRWWPAYLFAGCAANLVSDLLVHERSVPVSLGLYLATSTEACLGAGLLRQLVGLPVVLARVKDVLTVGCLTALFTPMFGATLGAGIVSAAFGTVYWSAWQSWWLADAIGVIAFAPMVLILTSTGLPSFRGISRRRVLEGAVMYAGTIAATEGVYGEFLPKALTVPILILPFALWAAFRFGPLGSAGAIPILALIGLWNSAHGRGPYALLTSDPREQLLRVQATLWIISVSMLALAAILAERRAAEEQRLKLITELEQALVEIRTLRGLIPLCAWCKKIRDDQGAWRQLEEYLVTNTGGEVTHSICPECLEKELAGMRASPYEAKDG
jgi:integral membrane sensor domain MASE1